MWGTSETTHNKKQKTANHTIRKNNKMILTDAFPPPPRHAPFASPKAAASALGPPFFPNFSYSPLRVHPPAVFTFLPLPSEL